MRSLLASLALFAVLTAPSYFVLGPPSARGDEPVPDSFAPPLSFCIGKSATCVLTDLGLPVVNYDLDAKKWGGGVRRLTAGYALLFAADEVYASGIAGHLSFSLDQAVPDYVAPTFMFVLARYFEFGATFELGDGYFKKYLTAGTSVPFELMAGSTFSSRLLAARRSSATTDELPAPPQPPAPAPTPDAGSPDAPAPAGADCGGDR